jgi:type III secretory pathway component EscR
MGRGGMLILIPYKKINTVTGNMLLNMGMATDAGIVLSLTKY